MASTIKQVEIETQRLQSDIDQLRSHLNGMKTTGTQMMDGINALSSMWEGAAKEAFTVQFKSDYETLNSMEEVIESMIKNLEYAREQYDRCESDVGSIINSIKV